MSFDRSALGDAIARHGRVARVVVAGTRGSAPRGAGTAMLVWAGGSSGTIGGGTLEWEALHRARTATADRLDPVPLGPSLGQCCGGSVRLLTELWDAERLGGVDGDVVARPLPGGVADMPLGVRRILATARGQGLPPRPGIVAGWMVEPVARVPRPIWIWGAGHVGRAIAAVLAPLPGIAVTLADTTPDRLPDLIAGVAMISGDLPALVAQAPDEAEHLVLTYSHPLDLELCHRVLSRRSGGLGLIGSATKAARFGSRLAALGHPPDRVARMACPIGDPTLGKHPHAIALGVATAILRAGVGNAEGDAAGAATRDASASAFLAGRDRA